MAELAPDTTWPSAVAQFAKEAGTSLPPAGQRGMGSVVWKNRSGNRFVTFRPLLKTRADRETARADWTLWHDENDRPRPALTLTLPLRPTASSVGGVVTLIDGWLSRDWTDHAAEQHARAFAEVTIPTPAPTPVVTEYELGENGGFTITVNPAEWFIRSGGRSLTTWKSRLDDGRGDGLRLDQLDRLCGWLAHNWYAVAHGSSPRPPLLRDRRVVSACQAYQDARIDATPEEMAPLQDWWGKHAVRAADPELPNIFLERQGDDVVVSWDASPSEARAFMIPYGTEITNARVAVPVLRRLVTARVENFEGEPKYKRRVLEVDVDQGRSSLRATCPALAPQWLDEHTFSEEDAREMALTGTARHPVVGLLRSAQGSTLSVGDLDAILTKLRANPGDGFQNLRSIAKGKDGRIDVGRPWLSGYHLARLVRAELGRPETGYFDIEAVIRSAGIDVHDVRLADPTIRGACVGSPQFRPLIAVNTACDDANGQSGRRITLAHELCHLLFDRTRLRNFARFEGGAAEADRLIEMRANAFAVELLAPIESFFRPDGGLMTDEEAETLSAPLDVSRVAILQHVQNHRERHERY